MSQSFDLEELLGFEPTEFQKNYFGELIIDEIQDRTESGKDYSGKSFTQYTKEYADEKGVSRSNVTLFDNGDMLNSLSLDISGSNVKIELDEDQTGKGYGHQSGFEGHPFLRGPKRKWFGVTQKKVKEIISKPEFEPRPSQVVTLDDLLKFIQG